MDPKNEWQVVVEPRELIHLLRLSLAVAPGPGEDVEFVVSPLGGGRRRWTVEGFLCSAWLEADGPQDELEVPIAVSRTFLEAVYALGHMRDKVVITGDYEGAYCEARIADDFLRVDGSGHAFTGRVPASWAPAPGHVSATMNGRVFARAVRAYRDYDDMTREYSSGPEAREITPFMTVRIDAEGVTCTSDWHRSGHGKVTNSMKAQCTGHDTVAVHFAPFRRIEDLIWGADELTIGWDPESPEHVHVKVSEWVPVPLFETDAIAREDDGFDVEWGLSSRAGHETMSRMYPRVMAGFQRTGHEPVPFDGPVTGTATFTKDGGVVTASAVSPGGRRADYVRIATRVASVDPVSVDVYDTINRLNDKMITGKLVVEGTEVHLLADFPEIGGPEVLARQIEEFRLLVGECEGLDEFLPLFSSAD